MTELVRFLLAIALFAPSAPRAVSSDETLRTFDACWKRVRELPRAQERDDVAWDELRREYRARADAAEPGAELRAVLNEMLGEVGISHTAVLDRPTYRGMMREIAGRPTPTFGLLLEEMKPGRLFVRAMYEQGPAERAGLKLGDEVVGVGNEPPLECDDVIDAGYDPRPGATRLFSLEPRDPGASIELLVRSTSGAAPRRARLVCEETSGLEAGRRSVRVVRRDGARVGVLHVWMMARGTGAFVQEAIRGELATCDALVVDLRGRGGLADEIDPILAPFRARQGRRAGHGTPAWTKPVVFLVDDRTRSAKEIAAWYVRHEGLGPLVGEKTEGAVLGAHFVPLPGENWMEMGAVEVPVKGGLSLEGVGVAPTHRVEHLRPFARGVDPILETGLDVAAGAVARSVRRRGPI